MVSSIGATCDAVAGEDGQVVLAVLRHLQHGRVFQQRLQPRDHLVERDLDEVAGRLEAAGRSALARGRPGCSRPRPARWPGRRRRGRRWPRTGRRSRCRRRPCPAARARAIQASRVVEVADADVGVDVDRRGPAAARRAPFGLRLEAAARRSGALADPPRQGAELHLLQEGGQHLGVRLAHLEARPARRQGRVAVELHQLARQADLVGEVDQGLAALVLLDLAGAGQQRLEVAVLVDQGRGGLDPDARGARHVVDGVAAQGLDVDHLVRRHAELLEHLLAADADVLHGVEHGDAVADQLHQVLVGGDDHHLAAGVAGLAAVGGDQVVGLVARQLQAGHAEGLGRLAHQRELRDQVLGRAAGGGPCTGRRDRCGRSSRSGRRSPPGGSAPFGSACMSTSSFHSMLQKPCTAPTGSPSDLRVSGGRAWKARKMKPEPSTR